MVKNASEHALKVLGYYQLLELIAGYVQSPGGRRLIDGLRPAEELSVIHGRRGLVEDLLWLLNEGWSLPGLAVEDLSEILLRAQPEGAILEPQELLQCARQLEAASQVLQFAAPADVQSRVEFMRLISGLDGCNDLRQQLIRSIAPDGGVLDSASPALRELRRAKSDAERRLQRMLDGMIHGNTYGEVLQDRFVTIRNGRYVLPVKRDAQREMPGLVHDVSASGQTLFVEPSETVGVGNTIQTLAGEERLEVRRILAALSSQVRQRIDAFRGNMRILARLDAAAAIARWGAEYQCILPSFGRQMKLQCARHPLLLAQFRQEGKGRKVVPLDVSLPKDTRTLAITGSNTGGKTVALKTMGLIALAAQSGLPVPVGDESTFEVFQQVFADIGDEQSLAENLSTFSGHLENISAILKGIAGGRRTLVLLDELGSGTDPQEGGAIACSILDELAAANTLAVVTTHLGIVKNHVHAQERMVNAAVRFNADTLQPEYILDVGRPGASHALMIARRLGIPPKVIKRAESFLTGEELRLEEILARMDHDQRQLAARSAAAESARQSAVAELEGLRREREELKRSRKQLMNEAYQRAESMVDNTRRDLEHLLQGIRERERDQKGGAPAETRAAVDAAVAAARKEIAQRKERLATGIATTAAISPNAALQKNQLEVGKKIWVEKLRAHGRVVRLDPRGKNVTVDVDGLPFTLKVSELFPAQPGADKEERPKETTVSVNMPRYEGVTSHEINLIGMRVEEAQATLAQYLNDCVLARLDEVRVVHGFGTGRLREGIQQWLRRQSVVESFRTGVDQHDVGGGGVTFVTLKRR